MSHLDDYHKKIQAQMADLVSREHARPNHVKFDDLLKEFWSCQLEDKHDPETLNSIIDNFFSSDYFQPETSWIYKEIDDQSISLEKVNPQVYKEYDHKIDLIKYIIKTKSNIGKQYWKQVVEKTQDFLPKFSDGKNFQISNDDQPLVLKLNQIQYDLAQLENIFLTKLAQNYLDYKDSQKN